MSRCYMHAYGQYLGLSMFMLPTIKLAINKKSSEQNWLNAATYDLQIVAYPIYVQVKKGCTSFFILYDVQRFITDVAVMISNSLIKIIRLFIC